LPSIIGSSPAILEIQRLIRQIAATESNVMIFGPSGTGKELAASAIHRLSRRAQKQFLPINCASFAEDLLANELFGHEKDAFTGATTMRPGLLETTDGGTIFFDEVGDMPLSMQAKLLRVVQERELIRVGGSKPIKIDVRIISATNKDLKLAMKHGTFREDLYYRLNVVPIEMPPLAERKEDIPLLAKHFLTRFNRRCDTKIIGFSKEAIDLLCTYEYPGNVRELENLVERSASLCRTEIIDVDSLPADLKELQVVSMKKSLQEVKTLQEVERDHIEETLSRFDQNKSKAAKALGIDRVSLYRKLKKSQIKED
jgi:DNA-binding NtrC family response regulator